MSDTRPLSAQAPSGEPVWNLDLTVDLGDFHLEVAIATSSPVVAMTGPSGSGKTTLLMAVAGLVRPARGRVEVGGRVLLDSAARILLPARDRRLGMVFQEDRLLPHQRVARAVGWLARSGPDDLLQPGT